MIFSRMTDIQLIIVVYNRVAKVANLIFVDYTIPANVVMEREKGGGGTNP